MRVLQECGASDGPDALCLRALGALGDLELDALRLVQRAVALGLDGRVVHEDVVTATVLGDEAVALLCVEPLHSSLCHVVRVLPGTFVGRARARPGHAAMLRPTSARIPAPGSHP